jgi:uncharacterized protein YyaL (SSP411 family)
MPVRSSRGVLVVLLLLVAQRAAANDDDAQSTASPPKHTNRLAKESSPYLLLHAHNPVDWYPWGEEALAKAKTENKPIFLSIGYSSCHWCHVMERESFMDDEIASAMNANFVCVKVDREERPDVDEIYMHALQVYLRLVGSKQGGGWPLSMFLTPDAKPLMGGTYFPPRDRPDGATGFLTVIARVNEAWVADREKWQKAGDALADYVAESLKQQPILKVLKLEPATVDSVLRELVSAYDDAYGGFGFNPANPRQAKFPEPPNLVFLTDYARRRNSDTARKMLARTLEKIAQGGIRDHVGGGFHRYSTDRYWRVPHFEKMLYDNGQLVSVYTRAYELSPKADYQRAVEETIAFMNRELLDPGGAYYAALDADTAGEEGRYYVWQRDEAQQALSPDEYTLWSEVYGLAGDANFEDRYIPLLARPLAEEAMKRNLDEASLAAQLRAANQKLLAARALRARPPCDTKILSGWNGLAIRGLADAGRIFKNDEYTQAAAKAADFVLNHMRDPQGRLLRSHAAGAARGLAYLDDYAYLVDGLIALHQATADRRWLDQAGELAELQLALFWDDQVGGFFYTSSEHEQLLARSKMVTDGVTPSGNSVSTANLLALATALDKPDYTARAEKCLRVASPVLEEHPAAVPQLAVALSSWLERSTKPAVESAK